MTFLLGALLGVAASVAAWMVIAVSLRPRFRVGPKISARVDQDAKVFYRVKIQNHSKRRSVVDVTTAAIIEVTGVDPRYPSNFSSIRVPMSIHTEPFPVLRPRIGRVIRLHLDRISPEDEALSFLRLADLPAPMTGRLEDLLALGESARVVFIFSGSRDNSGVRRTIVTTFGADDIAYRPFQKGSEQVCP